MSKSIKYRFDQQANRLVLLENANKDDYCNLNQSELNLINQQIKDQYRNEIVAEFKNSSEYRQILMKNALLENQLKDDAEKFQNKLDHKLKEQELTLIAQYERKINELIDKNKQIELSQQKIRDEMILLEKENQHQTELACQKTVEQINNQHQTQISQLNEEKIKLQIQIANYDQIKKSEIDQLRAELTQQFSQQINLLTQQKTALENDKELLTKDHANALSQKNFEFVNHEKNLIAQFNNEKNQMIQESNRRYNELRQKYEILTREKAAIASVKGFGEDLERWSMNQFNDLITNDMSDGFDCTFEKINVAATDEFGQDGKKTKADFLFVVYAQPVNFTKTSENKTGIKEILRVVLEMKTQLPSTKEANKKHNEDHLHKLVKDMKTQNAQYGLLVSELESDQNWLVKKFVNYPNVFAIRPAYFISMLSLLRTFAKRKDELEQKLAQKEAGILKREELIKEFEMFKEKLMRTLIDKLNANALEIVQKADRIERVAGEISLLGKKIIDVTTFEARKKIEAFRLVKGGTFKKIFDFIETGDQFNFDQADASQVDPHQPHSA